MWKKKENWIERTWSISSKLEELTVTNLQLNKIYCICVCNLHIISEKCEKNYQLLYSLLPFVLYENLQDFGLFF